MPLPDRPRAVVTGAATGLGRAFALALASRRASILAADVNLEGAQETARLVQDAGGKGFATRCDVSRSEEVGALLGEADRTLGGVDLLVNNAGVSVAGFVGQVPLDDWAWIMGINLWGVIYGCHTFIPRFKEQRRGAILNVASAAGLLTPPKLAPYNVTKAGVVALSETLFSELAEQNITVTVLCPTFFKTGIASNGRTQGTPAERAAAEKRMAGAKIQADGVAKLALEAVDEGRLYALPHPDGRLFWGLKRVAPGFYHGILPRLLRMAAR